MDENTLQRLLQGQPQRHAKPGWRCPDDAGLAAFADQQLSGNSKASIESHLASCDSCLAQVSFLVKTSELPDAELVPAQLLSRARNLVSRGRSSNVWGWRWTAATAVAACLVFAVLLGIVWQLRQSERSADGSLVARNEQPRPTVPAFPSPSPAETPTTGVKPGGPARSEKPGHTPAPGVRRPAASGAISPNVLFPTEGAMVASEGLVLSWTPINEAVYYEINLMTAAGDLVFAERSTQAQLKLPAQMKLTPGGKYFVQVTVNLPQGNTIKSPVVGFRVSP